MATGTLAPKFSVTVENERLTASITDRIQSVKFDDTLAATSMVSLTALDEDHKFLDGDYFEPGGEIQVFMGYGPVVAPIGRGIIVRNLPRFSGYADPTFQVEAYDASYRLKKHATTTAGSKAKTPKKALDDHGVPYVGMVAQIVGLIADRNGLAYANDYVDSIVDAEYDGFFQPTGVTDYEILQSLANFYDAQFRVRYRPLLVMSAGQIVPSADPLAGQWVLEFKDNRSLTTVKPEQTIVYGPPGRAEVSYPAMLSANFSFGISETATTVQAFYFDEGTGDWILISEEDDAAANAPLLAQQKKAKKQNDSPVEFKLAIDGQAVFVGHHAFATADEARRWAKSWFDANRDRFILFEGAIPGDPSVASGSILEFRGFGRRYSGNYLVTRAMHEFSKSGLTYTTRISARQIIR